jgi:RHS repeat-associated protein
MKRSPKASLSAKKLNCLLTIEALEARFYPGSTLDLLGWAPLGLGVGRPVNDRLAAALTPRRPGATEVGTGVLGVDPSRIALVSCPSPWEGIPATANWIPNRPPVATDDTNFPARPFNPLAAATWNWADDLFADPLANEWPTIARGKGPAPTTDAGIGTPPWSDGSDAGGSAAVDRSALPSAPVASTLDGAGGAAGVALSADPAPVPAGAGNSSGPVTETSTNTGASTNPADDGLNLVNTQGQGTPTGGPDWSTVTAAQRALNQQSLAFEPNLGQTDARVRFLARAGSYGLYLTGTDAVMVMPVRTQVVDNTASLGRPGLASDPQQGAAPPLLQAIGMRLVGANADAPAEGLQKLPGNSNYFLGNDPNQWVTDVPRYAGVGYNDVYPGIDLVYYGNQDRNLEYDFIVAPGVNPGAIAFAYEGVNGVRLDADGSLVVDTAAGQLRQHAPVLYQEVDGVRRPVAGGFVLRGPDQVGFAVGGYDPRLPLVVDPAFVYSTFLGGSASDQGLAIAGDSAGNAYVTGRTTSTDFPTAYPLYGMYQGGPADAFVSKFSADGSTLLYSTYLGGGPGGGSGADVGYGIAADADGNAYVTGNTQSQNFPTTSGAFQNHLANTNGSDAFFTKFNANGSALLYSSYLGGNSSDVGLAIAADSNGNAYLTGYTNSSNFPTKNALIHNLVGAQAAFVTKFNPNLSGSASLVYSTYWGGNSATGTGIAVDSAGQACIVGATSSSVLRVSNNAYQTGEPSARAAFVSQLKSDDSDVVYSSFFGGQDFNMSHTNGNAVALDATGNLYITGSTDATNFPTAGSPYQSSNQGGANDAFVAKFDPTQMIAQNTLVWSTFLGGGGDDQAFGLGLDSAGDPYVAGLTTSTNFPTLNELQTVPGGNTDAFVTKLNNTASGLLYSTYLGGSSYDQAHGLAVDPDGNAYVVGETTSTDFPTAHPFQATNHGSNAFVVKLLEQPMVQRLHGTSSYWLDVGTAMVSPNTGTLRLSHPLDFRQSTESARDDAAGLGVAPALVYTSDTVHVRPVAEVTPQFDQALGVPTNIHLAFTWNGVAQYSQDFSTSGHSAGDTYLLAAQLPATTAVTATDRYPWQINVTGQFSSHPDVNLSYAGYAQVVVTDSTDPTSRDDSAFGPGWSLAGLNRIVPAMHGPAGVLLVYGDGTSSHFFAQNANGSYQSPADDFGTLTLSMGTYTYTSKDQVKWNFDQAKGLLRSIVDPHNLAVTFSYNDDSPTDPGRYLGTVTMPDGGVTTFLYTQGALSEIDEPGGRTVTVGRSGSDLGSITNPDTFTHTFVYDGQHDVTQEQWNPATASYTYDPGADLLSEVDRSQGVTLSLTPASTQGLVTPALSAQNAVATTQDGLGHVNTYTLDSLGRITKLQRQGVQTPQTWSRDRAGQAVVYTDGDQNATVNTYRYGAGAGDLTRTDYADGGNDQYQYDSLYHHLTRRQDPLGHVTSYTDNGAGDLTATTDPLSHTTSQTWSPDGLLQSVTDPLNHTTTYMYYASNRRLAVVTDPRSYSTNYEYDGAGDVTKTTDARGNVTSTVYDGMRQLTKQTNADMGVLSYTYNGLGETTSRQDSLGTVTYNYDAHGWQTEVKDARGNSTTTQYDAAGNVQKVIDPRLDGMGHPLYSTAYDDDGANRRTKVTDAAGNVTTNAYDDADNLTQVTDANTHPTQYGYDGRNRRVSVKDALMHTTTTAYDKAGNVTMLIDPNMHATCYLYDSADRRTAMKDPIGNTTTYAYDNANNLTQVIGPRINPKNNQPYSTTYDYDQANNRTRVTDGVGNVTSFVYDQVGNPTQVLGPRTDPLSMMPYSVNYEYDPVNRRTKVTDQVGDVTQSLYDTAGDVTAVVDANSHTTMYGYDPDHHQVVVTRLNVNGNEVTTYGYDAAGNQTKVVDANGHTTLYDYDGLNRRTKVTDPLGNVSSTVYDPAGNVTATVDARGYSTSYFFDNANRQTRVQDPEGNTTSTLYDPAGNVTVTVDGNGKTTSYEYDFDNRRTKIIDPLMYVTTVFYDAGGNETGVMHPNGKREADKYDGDNRQIGDREGAGEKDSSRYDAAGNLTKAKDGLGHVTRYFFDPANRRTAVTDPNNNTTTSLYDPVGNVTAMTDAQGNTTDYGYDWANRRTSVDDRNGKVTTSLYDKVGNVLEVIDANQNTTSYGYDLDNRQTFAQEGTLMGVTTTQYDPDGNVAWVKDPNGNLTTFNYNKDDLQTLITDSYGKTVNYSYDGDRRQTHIQDRLGRTRDFQFNDNGWLVQETRAGGALNETLTYNYDQQGNQTFAGSSNGSAYTFAYDTADRVTRIQEPFGAALTYQYDKAGNVTAIQDSFGGVTSSTYDPGNRLTNRKFSATGSPSLSLDVQWTTRNDVATLIYYSDSAGTQVAGRSIYDLYDNEQRLKHEKHLNADGSTVLGEYTYTYDDGGRLTTQTWTSDGGPTVATYGYDSANRLTTDTSGYLGNTVQYDDAGNRTNSGFVPTVANQIQKDFFGYTYTYDAEGNLTRRDNGFDHWEYTYDNVNHLISVKHFTGATQDLGVAYTYDALGQRIENDTTQGMAITSERYAYDRGNVWADLDPLSKNALRTRRFFRDGVDAVFAEVRYASGVGSLFFDLADRQGSVRVVMDGTGAAQKYLDYDGYGAPIRESNLAMPQRYRFTGREWDVNTKLQYNRSRDYDPVAQHWLQQDTAGFRGGDYNLYRYVHNGPTNATDPTGQSLLGALGGAVIGFVIGAGIELGSSLLRGEAPNTANVLAAGLGGAVNGAIVGALAGSLTGDVSGVVLGGALIGALGAAAGNATTQGVRILAGTQESFDTASFGVSTVAGFVGGGVGAGVFRGLAGAGGQATFRALAGAGVAGGASGGAVGGAYQGALQAAANGSNILVGALGGAGRGALEGGVAGLATAGLIYGGLKAAPYAAAYGRALRTEFQASEQTAYSGLPGEPFVQAFGRALRGGAEPPSNPTRASLTRERGQEIVDELHRTLPPDNRRRSVTSLTELEDGRFVLTNSSVTRGNQRQLGRGLLGDDLLIPDEPHNQGYIPRELRDLPGADTGSHGEARGVQAGRVYGTPARRQWSSSEAGHGGAACGGCEAIQQEFGVRNETGFQSQGGRFDRGGVDPDFNQ